MVFEGGEGAGKSTQAALLTERLRASRRSVTQTREPGAPDCGGIRSLVLADAAMSARCEALLFAAARAEHVAALIEPALARGEVVVCDRYIDSSLAYQGYARELNVSEVAALSRWATLGLLPDVTVLLDVEPGTGLTRATDGNRMESEDASFHRRVRAGLLGSPPPRPIGTWCSTPRSHARTWPRRSGSGWRSCWRERLGCAGGAAAGRRTAAASGGGRP